MGVSRINDLLQSLGKIRCRLQGIPVPLRVATVLTFVGGIITPLTGLFGEINGFTLVISSACKEFIDTASQFSRFVWSPIYLAMSYGIFLRKKWVQPLLVCWPIALMLPPFLVYVFGIAGGFWPQNCVFYPAPLGFAIFTIFNVVVIWRYLFFNKSARSYFGPADSNTQ